MQGKNIIGQQPRKTGKAGDTMRRKIYAINSRSANSLREAKHHELTEYALKIIFPNVSNGRKDRRPIYRRRIRWKITIPINSLGDKKKRQDNTL